MDQSIENLAGQHDVDALLHRVSERLAHKFAGTFNPETIDRYVHESYLALHRTARVRQHLPALAEHFATDRLTALAQAKGTLHKPVPEVLFLCVHNAGRSQMAAVLLDYYAEGLVHVRSAGSQPAADVEEKAIEAMREIGLDLTRAFPKPLTDDVVRAADVIITMGCGDACPILPGKQYRDWEIPDPDGQSLDFVRSVRDELDTRVRALLAEIG